MDGQWIQLNGLQVKGWNLYGYTLAQIETDGTITLTGGIRDLTLEFTKVTNVQSIRLDVTETDRSDNHLILREIIPGFIGKF